MGNIVWQVDLDGRLEPTFLSPDAETDGNFLIIAMPDNYVQPGIAGRRSILCSGANGQTLEARLASPSKGTVSTNS